MDAKSNLKHYFGYDSFRGGQEEVVNAILEGRDVLAIMPTGERGIFVTGGRNLGFIRVSEALS